MKNHWRKLYSLLPRLIEKKAYQKYDHKLHSKWVSSGGQPPVSHFSKQKLLIEYAKRFNLSTLVETGTYLGDMLYALENNFKNFYSIELSKFYYKKALNRFKKNKFNLW